jgi:hypothetical protein
VAREEPCARGKMCGTFEVGYRLPSCPITAREMRAVWLCCCALIIALRQVNATPIVVGPDGYPVSGIGDTWYVELRTRGARARANVRARVTGPSLYPILRKASM